MTTLIAVYNSSGCVGRCDAKCYDAEYPTCACVCGGMNHGSGLRTAMENTTELAEEWVQAYSRRIRQPIDRYEVCNGVQLSLL